VLISSVLQCYVCILRTVSQWDLVLVLCVIVFVVTSCYVIKASFGSYFIRDQLYGTPNSALCFFNVMLQCLAFGGHGPPLHHGRHHHGHTVFCTHHLCHSHQPTCKHAHRTEPKCLSGYVIKARTGKDTIVNVRSKAGS